MMQYVLIAAAVLVVGTALFIWALLTLMRRGPGHVFTLHNVPQLDDTQPVRTLVVRVKEYSPACRLFALGGKTPFTDGHTLYLPDDDLGSGNEKGNGLTHEIGHILERIEMCGDSDDEAERDKLCRQFMLRAFLQRLRHPLGGGSIEARARAYCLLNRHRMPDYYRGQMLYHV